MMTEFGYLHFFIVKHTFAIQTYGWRVVSLALIPHLPISIYKK